MTTPTRAYLAASLLTLSMSPLACADTVKPQVPPPTGQAHADRVEPAIALQDAEPDDGRSGSIVVDQEIAKQCELPTTHFAFDHADVAAASSDALNALATCFATGALKGRALALVGHADPRGELQYNFALGQRRAGSVEAYLGARGIEKSHMTTSSQGELEATGDDAASWARDRKVEIFLAKD